MAYKYYVQGMTRAKIGETLGLLPATVSRLLKRVKDEGIVEVKFDESFLSRHRMEAELTDCYVLQRVVVVPIFIGEASSNAEEMKRQVALEGARYVQRVIKDGDVLGLGWAARCIISSNT